MECWLGLFMSMGRRVSCHFKDAFIIFKILTSSSILLISWQLLIKHESYFPFQCFLFVCVFWFGLGWGFFCRKEEGYLEGVLVLGF